VLWFISVAGVAVVLALLLFSRSRVKVFILVVVCLSITALIAWYPTPYRRGVRMAYADHARGHYELKWYGGPALPTEVEEKYQKYTKLLKEQYGVVLTQAASCEVSDGLVQFVDGYNQVSMRLLAEKYGRDVLDECGRAVWKTDHYMRFVGAD
jgi:hypothetical protein